MAKPTTAAKKAQKEARAAKRSREHQVFDRLEAPNTGFKGFRPSYQNQGLSNQNGYVARSGFGNTWGSGPTSHANNLRSQGIRFVSGGKLSHLSDKNTSEENADPIVATEHPDQSQSVLPNVLPGPATAPLKPVESSKRLQESTIDEAPRMHSFDGPSDTSLNAKLPEDKSQRRGSSSSSESEVIVFRGKARPQAESQPLSAPVTEARKEVQRDNGVQNDQKKQSTTENPFRLRPQAKEFVASPVPTPPAKSERAPFTKNPFKNPSADVIDLDSATSDDKDADIQDYIDNLTKHQEDEGDEADDNEPPPAFTAGVSRSLKREIDDEHKVKEKPKKSAADKEWDFVRGRGQPPPDSSSEDLSDDGWNAGTIQQVDSMADEEIARLLNKQASLGMPNDRLILDSENLPHDDAIDDDFIPFSFKKHTSNRSRSKRNNRAKKGADSFPAAEAFADALDQDPYNGFDVMDFDRPSLKAKKTGRKSNPPAELSDEELTAQMQATWQKDREKKAEYKKERERLRAEENPGGRVGPSIDDDDDDDYSDLDEEEVERRRWAFAGNDITSVKTVIRKFLITHTKEELPLPIMTAEGRAQVHRLAKALGLKSKSHGKDPDRFIVLARLNYFWKGSNVNELDNLMNLSRYSDKKGRFNNKYTGGARGRKGMDSLRSRAVYQDGDVVGASAPELGSDNRGRAMLEKMGWSQGMGIGKEGKEGNVDAIKHVVKTTRAGLG